MANVGNLLYREIYVFLYKNQLWWVEFSVPISRFGKKINISNLKHYEQHGKL
jgi:hypothetical protein